MTRKKSKKILLRILIVVLIVVLGMVAVLFYLNKKASKVVALSFEDCVAYTTRGVNEARISVGILQNGESSITVYGKDAQVLEKSNESYEIGSLTKTFTAALLYQAIDEGKASLNDSIDQYLDLPKKEYYPTLERLVTHRSGYASYYFEFPMVGNFLADRNDFYGISRNQILNRIGKITLADRDYDYEYSNFGLSVVGLVLEQIYGESYTDLVNRYASQTLQLPSTHIVSSKDTIDNAWSWQDDDAYLPAGGLVSNMNDMLHYASLLLQGSPAYLIKMREPLATLAVSNTTYERLGIRLDAISAVWVLDDQNGIIWHNGGTGHYTCYLGFDPEKQLAVVVLTNLAPDFRIPATVLGAKRMLELQKDAN
jgi:CubicO group peptidase (beta-lactamase class C family)